jgi:hypothetical protein
MGSGTLTPCLANATVRDTYTPEPLLQKGCTTVQNSVRIVITLALAVHGVGHTVGFGVPAPSWFAAAWLLAGAGFVMGAWAFWTHRSWWEPVVFCSALASLALEAMAGVSLQPGPYASAAIFNALTIILLLVPRTRRQLAHL